MWALPTLALALAAAGCGGDGDGGGSDAPADDPEIVAAVTEKIGVAAGRIANATRDRNLPGPYEFKTVCLPPEEAAKFGTPRESVQCHIEAFTVAHRQAQAGLRVERGLAGPGAGRRARASRRSSGEYRIRNYLRKDHRLNCSGGETPRSAAPASSARRPRQSGLQTAPRPPGAAAEVADLSPAGSATGPR